MGALWTCSHPLTRSPFAHRPPQDLPASTNGKRDSSRGAARRADLARLYERPIPKVPVPLVY